MYAILVQLVLIGWPFSPSSEFQLNTQEIFEKVAGYYRSNDLDSAKLFAQQALTKSENYDYSFGSGRSLFYLGAIANREGKPSLAIPHLLKALEKFSESNHNKSPSFQAEICVTLGKIFRQHVSIKEALSFYEQGIDYALASNNKSALRSLLYNQSIAYRRQGDLINAIDVLTRSMEFISDEDHKTKQKTYNQFGLIYTELNEFDEAQRWFENMIELESQNPSPKYYRAQAYHNLAYSYQLQKNYSMAWKYYMLAAHEKQLLGNTEKLFITYQDMAELALLEGKNKEAGVYAKKAVTFIQFVPKTPEYYSIYKILSQSFVKQDPVQAISYANQFIAASEEFNNQQKKLLDNGDKYKVQLIASNYFNQVKREKQRLKMAWTASCAAAFVFLAIVLAFKLLRIYNYRSPELALSHIKNPQEMHYLLDLFRKEKEEMKNTMKQQR